MHQSIVICTIVKCKKVASIKYSYITISTCATTVQYSAVVMSYAWHAVVPWAVLNERTSWVVNEVALPEIANCVFIRDFINPMIKSNFGCLWNEMS